MNLSGKTELIQIEHMVFYVTVLDIKAVPLRSLQVEAHIQWRVKYKNQAQTCLLSPSLITATFFYVVNA